jgi:hypothetical protein
VKAAKPDTRPSPQKQVSGSPGQLSEVVLRERPARRATPSRLPATLPCLLRAHHLASRLACNPPAWPSLRNDSERDSYAPARRRPVGAVRETDYRRGSGLLLLLRTRRQQRAEAGGAARASRGNRNGVEAPSLRHVLFIRAVQCCSHVCPVVACPQLVVH